MVKHKKKKVIKKTVKRALTVRKKGDNIVFTASREGLIAVLRKQKKSKVLQKESIKENKKVVDK